MVGTKTETITMYVGNKPQEVAVGSKTVDVIQEVATNCQLRSFTLMVGEHAIEEGDTIPEIITHELDGQIKLLPYDRAA